MSNAAEVSSMAQRFNVDAGALQHLLTFLASSAVKHAEEGIDLASMNDAERDEYIKRGVIAWRDQSEAFLMELRDNQTERAQAYRAALTEQVYNEARAARA